MLLLFEVINYWTLGQVFLSTNLHHSYKKYCSTIFHNANQAVAIASANQSVEVQS